MPEIVLSPETVVRRSEDIVVAEADEDLVMLSIERGTYYSISDTARHIWDLLETPLSIAALVDRLAGQYDVGREDCLKDVRAFVEELRDEGLVAVDDAAAR